MIESAATAAGEAATAAAAAAAPAGGEEAGGEGLGGEDLGLGGEEGGGEEAAAEEPAGDENPLLAAPGMRDQAYLTPGAKGKFYTPETVDSRKGMGPRRRSYAAQAGQQTASSATRNLCKGAQDINKLAVGVTEMYEKDETLLFETKNQIKNLISQLEAKNEDQAQ